MINTFKGTQGKWEQRRENQMDISTKEKGLIATTFGGFSIYEPITITEQEANAKLIAAAPEMLKFIIQMAERYPNSEWIYKEAKEIIEKATQIS